MDAFASGPDELVRNASAGVVEALTELAAGLPSDLPFAVMVAVHLQVGGHAQVWR